MPMSDAELKLLKLRVEMAEKREEKQEQQPAKKQARPTPKPTPIAKPKTQPVRKIDVVNSLEGTCLWDIYQLNERIEDMVFLGKRVQSNERQTDVEQIKSIAKEIKSLIKTPDNKRCISPGHADEIEDNMDTIIFHGRPDEGFMGLHAIIEQEERREKGITEKQVFLKAIDDADTTIHFVIEKSSKCRRKELSLL